MMDLMTLQPDVEAYVASRDWALLPEWRVDAPLMVEPLAQGEYNMNYVLRQGPSCWVLRVNIASQLLLDDQIVYEYNALRLLEPTGVTPQPYTVDDSRQSLPYGVLTMSYLPGERMDYRRDALDAARLFAHFHALSRSQADNHLIREEQPLSMTYEECARLLPTYLDSDLADPALRDYLAEVLDWAGAARHQEAYFVQDPWPCVINTEVNSSNFIADREAAKLYLVDWEKPLWGDPSQDLSHFCAPMTTLWKTDYCMSAEAKRAFIDAYREAMADSHLANTIWDRVRLRDPFNYLRGISWSAMAWVAYQTGEHALRNQDTFIKVSSYLDLAFLRQMFDPYLASE